MRTEANWYARVMMLVMALTLSAIAMSCGGNGPASELSTSAAKSAQPATVSEDGIGNLPAWQQAMLSDPGWNQPYIAPREGTPVTAPSLEDLIAGTEAKINDTTAVTPRGFETAEKGASWVPPVTTAKNIQVAEYENYTKAQTPAFGCNGDTTNQAPNGHALEDIMLLNVDLMPAYRASFVNEGQAPVNYFNATAGTARGASSAVYQTYSNSEKVDFTKPLADVVKTTELAEMSYRSSLVPNGAPGSGCQMTGSLARTVKGYFWLAYNLPLSATPSMSVIPAYQVLIAPAGSVAGPYVSAAGTTGKNQEYYFGTVSSCYGGAWIVGLTSTTSACTKFKGYLTASPATFTLPIYGVLLKRWDDMKSQGQAGAWLTDFGWPVYGPVPFANGAQQLGVRGTYYEWGMWFERGYIWWVDYDNGVGGAYPNVPDEAQAYRWTGKNVYCAEENGAALAKLAPTVFYGGSGPLGVSVVVDSYRNTGSDPWKPVAMNTDLTEYNVAIPAGTGLGTVQVKMSANGYGGVTGTNPSYGTCLYKYFVWAFRDGTVQLPGTAFDPVQKVAMHSYGDLALNKESVYVVRVQVTDANNTIAYGDSLPLVLGHSGGSGGPAEIMVIRDDAPTFSTYSTNYDNLIADLTEIGASFNEVEFTNTVAADFAAGGYKVAIWYRGGPGAAGEPDYTTAWSSDEQANFNELLKSKMLLISQSHEAVVDESYYNYFGFSPSYGVDPESLKMTRLQAQPINHTTDQNMGLTSNETNGVFGWLSVWMGSDMGKGNSGSLQLRGGLPGVDSTNAAERVGNALPGGSGVIPTTWNFGTGTSTYQICTRGWYPPFGSSWINPGWTKGVQANPTGSGSYDDGCYGAACLSYGNASSGGSAWNVAGTGKFWCIGVSYTDYAPTAPAGATRANVLQNDLAWLDQTLEMGGGAAVGGASGFSPYAGNTEIVTVTPGTWSAAGYTVGQTSIIGTHYPDRDFSVTPNVEWAGTDVYRTTVPGTASANNRYIVTTTPGNNGMNANDLDFQFPWYGYITDVGANGVGTGLTGSAGAATDDTIVYRGLLLDDVDGNWARYTPAAGQTPLCVLNYADPDPVCAGYFVSTAGNTGDETYANYGQGVPALTFNNANKLEVECVAHWPAPAEGDPGPSVMWSMFPGHAMRVPGTSTLLTDSADGWEAYRKIYDIDPLVAASYNGVLRSNTAWNRGVFTYTSTLAKGRVVSFDYRKVRNWNGDLNRNGAVDQADKFPVRARIVTNQSLYDAVGNWPNHEPVLDPDPAVTSYVEGGCYVVDNGVPVYTLQITDDPAYPNPGTTGTPNTVAYVSDSGGYSNWNITCGYSIKFGTQPYTIQYRVGTDLDGAGPGVTTWGGWTAGITRTAVGNYTQVVPVSGTTMLSTFNIQIRATDAALPSATSTYTGWAAFSCIKPTSVFVEDFETGGATLGTNTWTVTGTQTGSTFDNTTTNATGGGAQNGARCASCNNYLNNTLRLYQAGPFSCSAATNYNFQYYIDGYSEGGWDGLIVGYSLDGATWNYYGDGNVNGYSWGHPGYYSSRTAWTLYNQSINTGASTQIYVRIGFTADSSVDSTWGYNGYSIDNMKIS